MRQAFVEKSPNSINFLVKTGKVTPNGFTNIKIQDRYASLKEAQKKAEISNYIFGKITEYCQKLSQKARSKE